MIPSRLKKLLFILIIGVLVMAGLCYALFYLTKSKIEETATIEAQALEESAYQERTRALKNLIRDVDPDVQKLYSHVVAPDGAVAFIDAAETLARGSGISIATQSVDVEEATENKDLYENLVLIFTSKGSWSNTYHFLSLLENLPYQLTIEHVAMTHDGSFDPNAKNVSSSWNSSFSVKILKQK
jgi:hypothetical protein